MLRCDPTGRPDRSRCAFPGMRRGPRTVPLAITFGPPSRPDLDGRHGRRDRPTEGDCPSGWSTLLENGLYALRLVAVDVNGATSSATRTVQVQVQVQGMARVELPAWALTEDQRRA